MERAKRNQGYVSRPHDREKSTTDNKGTAKGANGEGKNLKPGAFAKKQGKDHKRATFNTEEDHIGSRNLITAAEEVNDEDAVPAPGYMQKIRQPRKSKEIESFKDEVKKEDKYNSLKLMELEIESKKPVFTAFDKDNEKYTVRWLGWIRNYKNIIHSIY